MTIEHRAEADGWRVVEVTGRLDQLLTPDLDACLNDLIDREHIALIVDLSGVDYINSGGLRALVSARRKAQSVDGNLHLAGLTSRVLEIFQMVGFDRIFTIFPNAPAALAALRAKS